MSVCSDFSKRLGEGNSGVVYEGIYDGERVAVKQCKGGLSHEQMYEFLMEIKIMAYIGDHPHIVKFYGVDISRLRFGKNYLSNLLCFTVSTILSIIR